MVVDELSEAEVRNQYSTLVDRIPSLREQKQEHLDQLRDDEDELDSAENELDQNIKSAAKHDNLLTSTISAFLPGGAIERETGWTFRGAEPLSEYNEPNPDAIFCNPDRNVALIVECKSSVSAPGNALTQLYDAADAVREYRDELSGHIGMEIEDLETAICVPSYHDDRIARQIEKDEENGEARERVYVWRWHHFEEERIDLLTRFENRTQAEATHDTELSRVLNTGIEITKERQATPSFYPSSHTFWIMENVFSHILKQRVTNDGPIRDFSGRELREVLTSQRHLPHYSASEIGERIYDGLLERLLSDNLVRELDASDTDLSGDGEYYRYVVRGRSIETLLKNLREKYRERAISRKLELKAKRQVLEGFDENQSSLDDFP
jgi:hypothetical protein